MAARKQLIYKVLARKKSRSGVERSDPSKNLRSRPTCAPRPGPPTRAGFARGGVEDRCNKAFAVFARTRLCGGVERSDL